MIKSDRRVDSLPSKGGKNCYGLPVALLHLFGDDGEGERPVTGEVVLRPQHGAHHAHGHGGGGCGLRPDLVDLDKGLLDDLGDVCLLAGVIRAGHAAEVCGGGCKGIL